MKKILLATSALVMVAGAASAEVALSGSARMGLTYADTAAGSTTAFSSRVRIVFTASGETGTGLSFGASMRADQAGGNGAATYVAPGPDGLPGTADDVVSTAGSTGTTNGDSTVFISGAFGKLTMGDVGGAADALVGQVSGVGYGPNDSLQEIGFVGTTKTAAYYEYSAGAVTFGLGAGQIETGDELSVAVKYATDAFSVALGYETSDAVDALHLGGSATFGAATLKARITDSDDNADLQWATSVDYAIDATTITAFYTDFGDTDTQHYGLGASYDLGGGATVAGGIVQQDAAGVDATFADVGLKFSF